MGGGAGSNSTVPISDDDDVDDDEGLLVLSWYSECFMFLVLNGSHLRATLDWAGLDALLLAGVVAVTPLCRSRPGPTR